METKGNKPLVLREADLGHWKLVEDFKERLHQVAAHYSLHPSFADPRRTLQYAEYLSLLLFGLLNPVVRTMRGLCAASRLGRVQE